VAQQFLEVVPAQEQDAAVRGEGRKKVARRIVPRPVARLAVPGQIAKLRAVERDKSRADEGHVGLR